MSAAQAPASPSRPRRREGGPAAARLTPGANPAATRQLSFLFDTPPPAPPPAARPRSAGERSIVLGHSPLAYQLRRGRRRTIGFQIDDRGLTISAPRWVALRDIEAAIVEKERWIRSRLEQWQQWREKRRLPEVRFADGGQLCYLGAALTLRLRPDLRATELAAADSGEELRLPLPHDAEEARVRDSVQVWLKEQARRVLGERLAHLSERNGVRCSSWALSSARSQWGSCAADGRILLNWRLVHYSVPVIDYVVAHELAHLKELHHGPEFWAQVGRLLPGFETARDHIKHEDLANLPL